MCGLGDQGTKEIDKFEAKVDTKLTDFYVANIW